MGTRPIRAPDARGLILEKDAADSWKPSKRRSKEKFDGIVALIIALGRTVVAEPEQPITPMVFHITGTPDDDWES